MLSSYIVLLRESHYLAGDPPMAFSCEAENPDHAEEQAENAYPNCDIVWVSWTNCAQEAFDEYYN